MDKFIEKLKKYCNHDFKYKINGSMVRVTVDNEISYEYDLEKCAIWLYERNNKSEIGRWSNRKISDFNFAVKLKSSFGGGIEYGDTTVFEEARTERELNELLLKEFEEKYFSVGAIKKGVLSLVNKEGIYQIVYSFNNEIHVIEESDDREYVFGRFYNELMYLNFFDDSIRKYTELLGVNFSDDELINLLGY